MVKFLKFIDAADDAGMWPVSKLAAITCAGDGAVLVRFASGVGGGFGSGGTENDLVTLTCTADTESAVMEAIAKAVMHSRQGVITVCDDVNSKFLTSNILSCAITLDS